MFSNCAQNQSSNRTGSINAAREVRIPVFLPLLLMQQGEQRAPRHILGHDGELAGVVQAGPHKLDDAGVIETTQDGHFSAEHVHV